MTDLRKAAEMALGALERYAFTEGIAIQALRQALAQPETEPVYAFRRKGLDEFCTCDKRRYDELAGKPDLFEVTVFYTAPVDAVNMSQERVDETAKREHEPYGYLWFTHQMERRFTHYRPKEEQRIGEVTPIYTAPPKREWVGIDEKEVAWLWFWMGNREKINGYEFAKTIEAKLKERNCG
jgi:hypothetical protein